MRENGAQTREEQAGHDMWLTNWFMGKEEMQEALSVEGRHKQWGLQLSAR